MANQARVASTDALESFRASLIVFLNKARRSVDDAGDEVRRTRLWLQNDQRVHWEGEVRRRTKTLEQAEQDLRNAQFAGGQHGAMMVRRAALNKATQSLEEANAKLRCVKKWNLNYDHCADPVLKRLESVRQFLDIDLPKAVVYLRSAQGILEQYAGMAPPDTVVPGTEIPDETGDPAQA